MYDGQEELRTFAHQAIISMLSFNVSKEEAYKYLTNKIDLMHCSYELQCCIFYEDPIEYIRQCDKLICELTKKEG